MEHLHHMRLVFQILASNKQFLKKSKCCLVKFQIACLGYIITQDGVHADESKILVVLEWPCPTTVHIRGLRGFFGLSDYCCKFVQNCSIIAALLTNMLRKNSFQWIDRAVQSFNQLKKVMTTTTLLSPFDFEQVFTVECDACDSGIGAVFL